ncbi:MAG: VWA-like domain-containing protein, partial [Pseudomonadota bacterium]|nr:VWA-like domain-containing protein [Pseudomonadota bacterium]
MTKFNLDEYTFALLRSEPFFAALSRRITKMPTTSIPTAGVCINKDTAQFEMVYNPEFMGSLSNNHLQGVLMHEFYHIIYEHVTGRLTPEGMNNKLKIANDFAIKIHISDKLPKEACIPGVGRFEQYESGLSAEQYYALLKDDEQFQKQEGQGEGGEGQPDSLDDHSGWGEADQETKQMAKERLRQAVEDAAKEASNKGSWGSVSSEMRKKIMDMINPKVDWRKVLRYFIKTSQRSNKRSTVRRINKRFPYIHAGKKVSRHAKIAISIDQSGSVSDSMLAAFFAELGALAKYAEFTVVPFDTEVGEEHVYVWKKGKRKTWDRVLCGGTCFNAPTKWVNERQFDGHIVL